MLLHLQTWPEVEAYLERSTGIIVPIGSTEQHGPTGLIGTDAICAEAIAKGVGASVEALVAPTLNIGMALHHLGFPGTISLQPSTLIQVLEDTICSLTQAGFRRFYFINGHGGNIATLKAAFAQIYARSSGRFPDADALRCTVANWFLARDVRALARELYGDREGMHATPSEVALTQFLYPDAIKTAPLSDSVGTGYAIYSAADFRRRYPDGRMGSDPSLATPEHGRQFYERAVKSLAEDYLEFLAAD